MEKNITALLNSLQSSTFSSSNFLDFLLSNSVLIILLSLGTSIFFGLSIYFGVRFLNCASSQCKDDFKPKMFNSLVFGIVCGILLVLSTFLS
jgi:hypothetical protein